MNTDNTFAQNGTNLNYKYILKYIIPHLILFPNFDKRRQVAIAGVVFV